MPSILSLSDRLQAASAPVAEPLSLSAPIRGWNTRDALDAMDPLDAVQLDNLFPDANGVSVRNGYQSYATGLGGPVQTLAEYYAGGTRKFLAAANGKIFDVSASGAVGAPLATGFTSDLWQTVAFLSRLFFMNGSDTMQIYDGTTVANATFTGVTLSTLTAGFQYMNRLFFWDTHTTGFWYAPLNSITGALKFFDLASLAPRGGNLTAMTTYSMDGGNGVQNFAVFIMSSGDCLIYFGTDPGDAMNWSLVGIYALSPPVSPRAVCNYGSEAFLTTYDDHIPLKTQLQAVRDGGLPPRSKISGAVQAAVAANGGSGTAWQALYYPKGRRLIFNIPNPDGSTYQHVQNTSIQYEDPKTGQMTSPWCRFVNMDAHCWGLFNNNLYFGSDGGIVYKADTGNLDVLGTVNAIGQQAWNTFNDPMRKQATAMRPVLATNGSLTYTFSIGFDYGNINIPITIVTNAVGSPWDTSPWDTSPWSAEQTISTLWSASGGSGVAMSVALNIAATQSVSWLRTDFRGIKGTAL